MCTTYTKWSKNLSGKLAVNEREQDPITALIRFEYVLVISCEQCFVFCSRTFIQNKSLEKQVPDSPSADNTVKKKQRQKTRHDKCIYECLCLGFKPSGQFAIVAHSF